jgi:amidase
VVLGKTNVPLMLKDWQSFNELYGITNNPWDRGRTPAMSGCSSRTKTRKSPSRS